jgi:hypothetical protein
VLCLRCKQKKKYVDIVWCVVVEGHEGKMVFGYMTGKNGEKAPVMLMVGRAQYVQHLHVKEHG